MSRGSEAVKKWRKKTKQRMIEAFGGKCSICGYDRCQEALEFHHLNPEEKEFSFGNIRANIKSWKSIVEELKKCICVCSNCHKEIHAGKTVIQEKVLFNEEFSEYKEEKVVPMEPCPECGRMKNINYHFCSKECAGKARRRVDWDKVDLKSMIESGMSLVKIGEQLGISDNGVRKRAKKLGLI